MKDMKAAIVPCANSNWEVKDQDSGARRKPGSHENTRKRDVLHGRASDAR